MAMTTVLVIFLMFGAWALVSAGQNWGARRDVQAAAAAAARAGAQPSEHEISAGVVVLDPSAVAGRAHAVLGSLGVAGAVELAGVTVTVTASRAVDYAFPAPGFAAAVSASASASAQRGVQGDEGG
jgi:hypothetical protein